GGGAPGVELVDLDRDLVEEVELAGGFGGDLTVAGGDAEVGAADAPVGEKLVHHPFGGLSGDGEAEVLGEGDDGGVDADDPAAAVDQGAAGVAGVERRGVLDDAVDEAALLGAEGAPEGGDDARGDGGGEAEGVADGDDELADAEGGGVAE